MKAIKINEGLRGNYSPNMDRNIQNNHNGHVLFSPAQPSPRHKIEPAGQNHRAKHYNNQQDHDRKNR